MGALFLSGSTAMSNIVSNTLIMAVVLGTLLLSHFYIMLNCYKDRKMKELKRLLHQTQERDSSPWSPEIASKNAAS